MKARNTRTTAAVRGKELLMKKCLLAILLIGSLVPFPALAGEGCQIEAAFSALRSQTDFFDDSHAYQVDSQLLLYRLPTVPGVGDVVEFEFFHGERSLLVEEIDLIAEDPALEALRPDAKSIPSAVVEVLSTSPAERARIRRFAQDAEVEVRVRLSGNRVETLSLSDLAQRSASLQGDESITPRAISPRLSQPSALPILKPPVIRAKSACEDGCYIQNDFCTDECVFVPNSGPCFDSCDEWLDECLGECAGVCTPWTNTSTAITLVSTIPVGPVECHYRSSSGKSWYVWTERRFKRTVTTTTMNADCTETVSTDVTYFNLYCWSFYVYSPGCFELYPTFGFC